MIHDFLLLSGTLLFLCPLIGLLLLSLYGLVTGDPDEKVTVTISSWSLLLSLCSGAFFCGLLFGNEPGKLPVSLFAVDLFSHIDSGHTKAHHLLLELQVDALALPFSLVTCLLSGIVGFFSARYLHRDPGHYRFFLLLLLFTCGMHCITLGGSFEVIFVGWEIVGLTSALLISFYRSRASVVTNALRAFLFYRLSDSALLLAIALAFSQNIIGRFGEEPIALEGIMKYLIPLLILAACMVKSAQYPFISWLPRAMEGPTPSSAIFYGGLSIHLGLFLLLRFHQVVQTELWFSILVCVCGLLTVVLASLFNRVQTDIKSSLALSACVQTGLMFIEVGAGYFTLALVHFVGHAIFRTYQILGAASLIHEGRGAHTHNHEKSLGQQKIIPERAFDWLYCFAFDGALGISHGGSAQLVEWVEERSRRLALFDDHLATVVCRLSSFFGISRLLSLETPHERDVKEVMSAVSLERRL